MDAKAVFLSSTIAFAAASSAMAQGAPPGGGVTVPPDSPLVPPGLDSGSELGRYNDTYLGLRSFWSDDIISSFFKHVADGTLNQAAPLVAELCEKWRAARSASADHRHHHCAARHPARSEPVVERYPGFLLDSGFRQSVLAPPE